MRLLHRKRVADFAILGLVSVVSFSWAADDDHGAHGAAPASAKPSSVKEVVINPKHEAASDAKLGEDSHAEDPLDKLRERLSQKLTGKSPQGQSDVLRVNLRSASDHQKSVAKAPAKAHAVHWDYVGEGSPENWGKLKSEYAKCSIGTRQSPIDIRDSISVQLEPVLFDYQPSNFAVLDNGHTIQVNISPGNTIESIGRRYELVQFHFHRPSEERINGRQFDMVVHLVHKDQEGRLAVVAVLMDRGAVQPVVQTVWNNLPLEKGEEVSAKTRLDLNSLLPSEHSYFTYMGSLTTPPCSEGVLWIVMKNPVSVSAEQIAVFTRLYPMNARPTQATKGRVIKGSN